jgi:FAD synthetase
MTKGKTNYHVRKNVKVLAFGTFDLLHPGHIHFLRQASRYGDELIVVVARDSTVKGIKGSAPVDNENERAGNVGRLEFVDKVVLGSKGSRKHDIIKEVRPDVLCLGYDQRSFTDGLQERLEGMGIKAKIVRLKAYKPNKFKTSLIKNNKNKKGKDGYGKQRKQYETKARSN